jgi:hypothetical protein
MEAMKIRVLACTLAALATGCSTINRETTFESTAGEAFVLIVADGMRINGSESYLFNLQKMEADKPVFLPDIVGVYFSGMGAIEGSEFKKPETLSTTQRFGGKPASPGDYALISRIDSAAAGYSSSSTVNCYAEGAPIFRLSAGHVNVITPGSVRKDASVDGAALRQQVAAVLAGYPKVTAPIGFAEVVGQVAFKTTKRLAAEVCKGSEVLSYSGS